MIQATKLGRMDRAMDPARMIQARMGSRKPSLMMGETTTVMTAFRSTAVFRNQMIPRSSVLGDH